MVENVCQIFPFSGGKIIENDDIVSFIENESGKVAPDKTGSACDEIFHGHVEVKPNVLPFSPKEVEESSVPASDSSDGMDMKLRVKKEQNEKYNLEQALLIWCRFFAPPEENLLKFSGTGYNIYTDLAIPENEANTLAFAKRLQNV